MPKEMKLIMERWDKFKLEEKTEINTVGQFKKFLKYHRAAEAGKEAGKEAMDIILSATGSRQYIYRFKGH